MEEKYFVFIEDRKGLTRGNEVGQLSILLRALPSGGLDLMTVSKEAGTLKITPRVHTSSELDSMMRNFVQSEENRRRYRLYKVDSKLTPHGAMSYISRLLIDRTSESSRQDLSTSSINLSSYMSTPTEKDIPWDYLAQLGVSKEKLEKSGELSNLLVARKTNLVPIAIPFLGETIYTEARLGLKRTDNNKFDIEFSPIKRAPQLNLPYMGHQFTPEERDMLNTMGNLGKVVELTPKTGEPFQAYISIDPQTYDIVSVNAANVCVPRTLNGVTFTDQQYASLIAGEAVSLGSRKSVNGTEYTSYIQVNAEKRGLEFIYGDNPTLEKKYVQQKRAQLKAQGVPSVIGTRILTDLQREAIANGKTLYLKDLVNKKTGEVYSSYIKLNKELGKIQFFRFNPDHRKSNKTSIVGAAQQIKPAAPSKREQTVQRTKKTRNLSK